MHTQLSIQMKNTAYQATLVTEAVKCDICKGLSQSINEHLHSLLYYISVHLYIHTVHCNTIGQTLMLTSAP